MEIKRDFKNSLLGRREIIVVVEAEKNPGIEAVKEMITGELKVDKELVVVKKLEGHYGKSVFDVEAFIYNTKDEMKMVEPKSKKKEGEAVPEASAAPAAEAPKVEEKPAEEKTVEKDQRGSGDDGESAGDGKVEEKKEEEKPAEGGSE